MAKLLAFVNIGEMYLYRWQFNRGKGITNSHAGVGIGSRVDENPLESPSGGLNGINKRTFRIGLNNRNITFQFSGQLRKGSSNVVKGKGSVEFRFASSKEV